MRAVEGEPVRLLCPEYRLPGRSMLEKWEAAHDLGFAGVELAGPASSIEERMPELRAAVRHGAAFPTVSSGGSPFVGDDDAGRRQQAVANLERLTSAIAELGGIGVTTPACFGLHSRAIPALRPPPDSEDDARGALVSALAEAAEHAAVAGVVILLEPINRYEDCLVNTLAQGQEIATAVGSDAIRLLADVFHMNIEEADLGAAIRAVGPLVGHVHLADSNRLEPGQGHLDFTSVFRSLQDIHYSGFCALECSLTSEPRSVLAGVTARLQALWAAAGASGSRGNAQT